MNWIGKHLVSDTLYWEPPLKDGLGGYKWGEPGLLKARWEYSRRIVYSQGKGGGSEIFSDISVWVSCELAVGGYLFEGGFLDFGVVALNNTGPDDVLSAGVQNRAMQVMAMKKIPSLLRTCEIYYKASVQKYGLSKRS